MNCVQPLLPDCRSAHLSRVLQRSDSRFGGSSKERESLGLHALTHLAVLWFHQYQVKRSLQLWEGVIRRT
ncbi:hypothetical protein KC19_6G209800 [Ceratodon purpureus]|uniref:Uncharacterized protein n=1 Tax=Ceratodon purpureus TaxID=3225 RepID=A0A8T0HJV7_CERPU|nr:hypothetical protein KC19_6G209800 [Ceratodon purpureus]